MNEWMNEYSLHLMSKKKVFNCILLFIGIIAFLLHSSIISFSSKNWTPQWKVAPPTLHPVLLSLIKVDDIINSPDFTKVPRLHIFATFVTQDVSCTPASWWVRPEFCRLVQVSFHTCQTKRTSSGSDQNPTCQTVTPEVWSVCDFRR